MPNDDWATAKTTVLVAPVSNNTHETDLMASRSATVNISGLGPSGSCALGTPQALRESRYGTPRSSNRLRETTRYPSRCGVAHLCREPSRFLAEPPNS